MEQPDFVAVTIFLIRARSGLWLVRAWFLKIDLVWIVSMRVCVCVCPCLCPCPRLLITIDVMWCDVA